jgi:tetratricopeptide (TPR) repeat protein
VTAYTLGAAARICKVSPARLRYWRRTVLSEPGEAPDDSRPSYEFRDLLMAKKVRSLLERGVPLRRIRSSMESLRECVPELELPLSALDVWVEGSDRVVVNVDGRLLEPDGQTVLDFAASGDERPVASIESPRAETSRLLGQQRARDWFECGCKLDTDRATQADAIEAYCNALEADPEFADAHCNLGSVYFNQDRRSQAKECFERALAIDPGHVEAHLNLATLLGDEERNQAALHHYKAALQVDPLSPDTHVSLALLYEKLGLRQKAREHWRRYLQLDPGGTWADLARRRLD